MKNNSSRIILMVSCFVLSACSKENELVYEVLEYKTNVPVANAAIVVYKCNEYYTFFQSGCLRSSFCHVSRTNSKGIARMSYADHACSDLYDSIIVARYWVQTAREGRNHINREGLVTLQVHLVGTYPADSWFNLYNRDERGLVHNKVLSKKGHRDTSFSFTAYANQVNNLSWSVNTGPSYGPGPPLFFNQGILIIPDVSLYGNTNVTLNY